MSVLVLLLFIAMLATLFVMGAGIINLGRGDENKERANKLMQYRVLFQGIALGLLALLVMLER